MYFPSTSEIVSLWTSGMETITLDKGLFSHTLGRNLDCVRLSFGASFGQNLWQKEEKKRKLLKKLM